MTRRFSVASSEAPPGGVPAGVAVASPKNAVSPRRCVHGGRSGGKAQRVCGRSDQKVVHLEERIERLEEENLLLQVGRGRFACDVRGGGDDAAAVQNEVQQLQQEKMERETRLTADLRDVQSDLEVCVPRPVRHAARMVRG